ncbi:conserved hypothetical protein [Lodderomyces elongisporus NRRL YB-4239]|uniref:J domain-containing protein n=1 Tax=Lodderomyces elongisporus (strain ATCC 11503 / CBS 2605 / JCM 1781 / NBRC 1676 / NRRL YB-4239) TaxID=379508 RepID=A5DU52_LODEL|nr:conserved hypothetical protein [Lodderomyces elongisporus NRRL YB-4239]
MFCLIKSIQRKSLTRICCCNNSNYNKSSSSSLNRSSRFAKNYATLADGPVDHHKRLDLHDWPSSKNPTAYEVFGLTSKDVGMSNLELHKIIKQKYVKLVKLYHPDTSLDLIDEYGDKMSEKTKRKRFDLIQESYDILKNPRRRGAYNRFQTTHWEQQGPVNRERGPDGQPYTTASFEAFRRANAHRTRFDFKRNEEFWSAGTWNDYYQMKYKRPPPTKEEFEKNKYKILAGVLAVGFLAFALQIMGAIDRTNQYLAETHRMNLQSMKDLNQSYAGGAGNLDEYSEAENVRKFLISRRSTIRLKQEEKRNDGSDIDFFAEREEPSDDDLLMRYAKGRVNKWDDAEAQWINERKD